MTSSSAADLPLRSATPPGGIPESGPAAADAMPSRGVRASVPPAREGAEDPEEGAGSAEVLSAGGSGDGILEDDSAGGPVGDSLADDRAGVSDRLMAEIGASGSVRATVAPAAPEPADFVTHTPGLAGVAPAEPAPAPPERAPNQPDPLAPEPSTVPDGPFAPEPSTVPDGPFAPEPSTVPDGPFAPEPDGPFAPDPGVVPDMPVSPSPAGPMPDMPLPDTAPGSIGDEVAAELAAQTPEPDVQAAPRTPEAGEWRGIVLVTGTDTDVGKTIVTAAIAAAAEAAGLRVAVIKPGQTGTADGGPTDIDLVNRLAAPHTARTLASYPEPLAPLAAARVAHQAPLELYEVVDAVRSESAKHDLVLVEGAGGLLVPMGVRPSGEPWTLADLATTLGVSTIVVSRAGLGTLNHTALTLEALARRGVPTGVVLGAWPAEPELVHWANLSELLPHLVGALPDGAGAMEPGVFRRSAPGWLTPALYGVLDDWRVWADEVS